MSSEDAISILRDSESPEILMVSQESNTVPLLPPAGDTLMSLLLQIQQFHANELQKQEAELHRMKLKCRRLAMVANDNAAMAKRYIKHCKGLKAKVLELKCQLRVLQSPLRQDGTSVPSKSDTSPPDQALRVDVPAQAPSNQLEELGRTTSKQLTKLASRKSKKKVRYSDVPTNPGLQQQAVHQSLVASSSLPLASRVKVEPGLRNENGKIYPSEAGSLQNVGASDILAPDTCASPAVQVSEGNSSSGPVSRRRTDLSSPPDDQRLGSVGHGVHVVPETVEVEDELGEGSLVDAPAYASTPIGSQTQMSVLSDSMHFLDHKMPASGDPSQKAASLTSLNRGALLPSPLPKSESQFPVDLSSTQSKSPTFCGEGFSNMTTPRGANDKARQHSTPNTEWTVPTPNTGDRSDLHDADESYESEASLLLLRPGIQKPAILANPFRLSLKSPAGTSGKASPSVQIINQEKNQTSYEEQPKRLEISKAVLLNVKQGGGREGTSTAQRTQAGPSRASASKKRKLDLVDEITRVETVLDLASSGKENSPESLNVHTSKASSKTLNRIKREKQVSLPPELSRAVELRGKGRSLKQSKINPDMFRSGMNKSASLMQEYNGGRLVNIDSQSDDFMRRAIELSLAEQEQMAAGDGVGAEVTGSFKVPALPQVGHIRQQHCIPETSLTELDVPQHPPEQREAELPDSLPEVSLVTYSLSDLNGSVDPLVDLTRMEEEGSFPCDLSITSQTSNAGQLETRRHTSGDDIMEGMHLQTAHDSCQDLFDGEESEPDEDLDRSTIRDKPQFIKDFDKVPKKDDKPNFKYTEVVRKHEERQKLKGFGCKECDKYYGGMSMTDAEREQRIKMCSRHRALYSPPNTPDHYWSIGFPDTQTIQERGYIKESTSPEKPTRRRKNRYKRSFFGKEVDEARDREQDNDQ